MSRPSTSPEGLRATKKRDKAARIRDAALALFAEKGFEGTTTREVAERAGVATGTLFLYVKTKEQLVDFVFREEIRRIVERRTKTIPEGELVPQLVHLLGPLLTFYGRDLALSRVLLREVLFAGVETEQMSFTLAFLGQLAALVDAAARRRGVTLTAPAQALAMHAFALYLGAVLSVTSGTVRAKDATQNLAFALSIHFAGVGLATSPKGAP